MKINNIIANSSKTALALASLICFFITTICLLNYFDTTQIEYSISNFINWYIITTKETMTENHIAAWFLFIILPLFWYGMLILSICARLIDLKKFNAELNLKSVEFLQNRINFNFTQPQCNIVCSYNDVEKLEMIIHTQLVHTKSGSHLVVSEIELEFSILNNKTFTLKNTPINIMSFIYSVIDYSRGMQNFSYSFEGYMEIDSIKEKIEDYLHKGFKQILSNSQENSFKIASIVFFIIAMIFLFSFQDGLEEGIRAGMWFILFIPGLFGIISFIFDFILIADKIKERKHKI